MKKLLVTTLALASFSVFADVELRDLSKKDVENISKEFGANFSHTTVSAPSTDGLWGIELGLAGGQTSSPDLKDVVDSSGGDGKDFKHIYHAGVFARAHFPFEIFAELSILPEQEISDVTVDNKSFELGWNAGSFFNLPLDLAIGINRSSGETSFKQDGATITDPDIKVKLDTQTTMYWVGVSKKFAFVTPYAKIGSASLDSKLKADGQILEFSATTNEDVKETSTYLAAGANFDIFFIKLGAEISQVFDTTRLSGKLSFSF